MRLRESWFKIKLMNETITDTLIEQHFENAKSHLRNKVNRIPPQL